VPISEGRRKIQQFLDNVEAERDRAFCRTISARWGQFKRQVDISRAARALGSLTLLGTSQGWMA
jgi:hypothetical protein